MSAKPRGRRLRGEYEAKPWHLWLVISDYGTEHEHVSSGHARLSSAGVAAYWVIGRVERADDYYEQKRRERSNLNYDRDCRCGHNTWAHEPTASCRVCECPCFDDRIGAA